MSTPKVSKRILSVTVKREVDTDPDTSFYGEYSNSKSSEFSIDRAHAEDCSSVTSDAAIETLERIQEYLLHQTQYASKANDRDWYEVTEESYDLLQEKIDELQECDCDESGDMERGQYRYFNPSGNYVNSKGNPTDGLTPDEVRKYVRQDYERMTAYNNQQWCFVGVYATADYTVSGVIQTVRSGGLWGTESDSDESHFAEIAKEELDTLKAELHAIGFTKRTISAAFRNVVNEND